MRIGYPAPGPIILPLLPTDMKKLDMVTNYIAPEGASSKDFFVYLLDEFNAYQLDLEFTLDAIDKYQGTRFLPDFGQIASARDGAAAFYAFVSIYVNSTDKDVDAKRLLSTIWKNAERSIERSCKHRNIGLDADKYLKLAAKYKSGMARVLGRQPKDFSTCAN